MGGNVESIMPRTNQRYQKVPEQTQNRIGEAAFSSSFESWLQLTFGTLNVDPAIFNRHPFPIREDHEHGR